MNEELWEPDPDVLQRIYDGQPSPSDQQYARLFAAIAEALDRCEAPGRVTLYLSTCRNEFLTVNAMFVDLKYALGTTTRSSLFERAVDLVRDGDLTRLEKVLGEIGHFLSEVQTKHGIWQDRHLLWRQYETAARGLGGLAATNALKALEPGGVSSVDDTVWDSVYLNVSREEGDCTDQLGVLVEVQQRCHRAYRLLVELSRLDTARASAADTEGTLFEGAPEAVSSSVDWTPVQQELSTDPAVWHVQRTPSGDGIRVIETDLPASGSAGGSLVAEVGPIDLFDTTTPGADTNAQVERALSLVHTAVEDARLRLISTFHANVAAPPMPAPFQVNLAATASGAGRLAKFNYQTPQMAPERPSDTVQVAALRCFVPENWHSHREGYWYDTRIANVDAVVNLVSRALQECAERKIEFLLLPEYFMPRDKLEILTEQARHLQVALIGGVQSGTDDTGKVVNEVAISFPRLQTLYQGKQKPSVFEKNRPSWSTSNNLVIVRDTALGNLAVAVCSDYLEADVVAGLAGIDPKEPPRPHTIIVCARNPAPDIFTTLARSDALRLYSNIIIVNSADSAGGSITYKPGIDDAYGCILATPRQAELVTPEVVAMGRLDPGQRESELLIWDVDMLGVKSRSNRTTTGFPPSFWAQEGDVPRTPAH